MSDDSDRSSAAATHTDAVTNLASGLGTGGEDRHVHTDPSASEVLDKDDIDAWYETGRFAPKIIDRPARDSVGDGPKIKIGDDEVLSDRLDELEVKRSLYDAARWMRLTGGAGGLIVTDDANPWYKPVDDKTYSEVKAFQVFDAWELTPMAWIDDIDDADYGEPALYAFHPDDRGATAATDDISPDEALHRKRLVCWHGRRLRSGRRDLYDDWGQPVLDRIQEPLKDLEAAISSGTSAAHRFQQDVIKIRDLAEKLATDEGRRQLEARSDLMELTQSFLHAVLLDADGEEYESRTTEFSSLVDLIKVLQEDLALASEQSLTVLFGMTPEGLSSNDETGKELYYDYLRQIRNEQHEPALRRLCYQLFREDQSKFDEVPEFEIEWPSLETPTEAEQADTELKEAKRHQADIANGVLSPEESRKLRYEDLATDQADDDPDEPELDTLVAEYMADDDSAGTYPEQDGEQVQRRDANPDALREAFPALKGATPFLARVFVDAYERRDSDLALDVLREIQRTDRQDATRPKEDPAVEASDFEPEKQRKGDVGYVNSSPGDETCEDCGWYQEPGQGEKTASCRIVRGGIAPSGWCRLWGTVSLAPEPARTGDEGDGT
jgi:phage-related protein (TIGR01555 family)